MDKPDILLRNNRDDSFSDISARTVIIQLGKCWAEVFGKYGQGGYVYILIVNADQKVLLCHSEGENCDS